MRTTDYFPYPLLEQLTTLQTAIYSVRAEQLEIYEIRNLCLLDKPNKLKNYPDQKC